MRVDKWILALTVVIILVIAGCVAVASDYMATHKTTITVKSKYVDPEGEETFYMIATDDGRIYEVNYCWWKGQNSIDKEWAYVEANKTYEVSYYGWDAHNILVDWYYVIYDFEEVEAR